MKELEQEREEQKSKWQTFNNKAYSKNKKGQVISPSFYRLIIKIYNPSILTLNQYKKFDLKII